MLDIILNEQKIINEALNNKTIDKNPIKTLKVLMKHYYLQKMVDKDILKEQLLYFMEQNYKGFKRSKWETSITNMVIKFLKNIVKYKTEVKIINIKSINITQKELDKIKEICSLDNIDDLSKKNLEKICFIMLVYAKLSNEELKSKESWISKSCSTILKESKVNLKGDEKKRIFYHLYNLKYISQSNATEKTSMKINYVDIEEESDVIITIDNFENVIYYYMNWKGENWKRCENAKCGKWVKITTGNNKYCLTCAKEINNKKTLENYYKKKLIFEAEETL